MRKRFYQLEAANYTVGAVLLFQLGRDWVAALLARAFTAAALVAALSSLACKEGA